MPTKREQARLLRLYSTNKASGLPPFLSDLYPEFLSVFHYLGDANSCPYGGPGISYGDWDFECDGGTTLVRSVQWGTPETPVRTALYRFRDERGDLLYVGVAEDPGRRQAEHAKRKAWWPEVSDHTVEWHPTRELALAAEAAAIRTERPRYNIQHNKVAA
jgi:predicted GIY-YIG superfamily endonuclease